MTLSPLVKVMVNKSKGNQGSPDSQSVLLEQDQRHASFGRVFKPGLTRTLLLWFLLLSLFPLSFVSWISYEQSKDTLHNDVVRNLVQRTALQSRFIKNWFDYRFDDLQAQAQNTGNIRFLKLLRQGLKKSGKSADAFVGSDDWVKITRAHKGDLIKQHGIYDYYYDLFLIDLEGNILFSVMAEDDLGTNLQTGPYKDSRFASAVQRSLESGQAVFSDLEIYASSENVVAGFLISPLVDENGDQQGFFAVQIQVDRINELMADQTGVVVSQQSYLIGEDLLLRSIVQSNTATKILTTRVETKQSLLWSRHGILGSVENEDHHERVISYSGLSGNRVLGIHFGVTIGDVNWALIAEVDEAESLAPARNLARYTIILLAATFVVILLLAVSIADRIVDPIRRLVKISQSVAAGKLNQQVVIHSDNEIGQLADSFNTMLRVKQRYESKLNESHRQLQKALDDVGEQRFALDQHAIVAITDIEGMITFVNGKFSEISGYSYQELLGQNHRLLSSGFHSDDFFRDMYLHISKGKVWRGEICNKAKNGTLYWVDTTIVPFMGDNGKPKSYIAIRTDISERKVVELENQRNREAAEIKLKIAKALSMDLPLPERLDKALAEVLGMKELKLQNKGGVFLLEEGAKELSMCTLQGEFSEQFISDEKTVALGCCLCGRAAVSGEIIVSDNCFTDHRHENSWSDMKLHGHYIVPLLSRSASNNGEQTLGVLFLYTDADPLADNERLTLLHEIGDLFSSAILQSRVLQSQERARLDADHASQTKSDFLANMSHEIRTPMNGVLGMLSLLENSQLNSKQQHQVRLASTSAKSLLALINDILDFSKIEAGKLDIEEVDFDLRSLLGDMAESMALQAQEKKLEIILDLSQVQQSRVKGDPTRLRQMLNNIVGNAIKFTAQGEVTVRAELVEAGAKGLLLRGSVSDTGIGIPEDKLKDLFDSFSQVDASTTRKYGGTGLGLAITKQLCELMGGSITVTSTQGAGSRFAFVIVLQPSEQSEIVKPAIDIHGTRILIVDDNATNLEVLREQLKIWGAEVSEAKDGPTALAIMDQQASTPFPVAIVDMQMPEMDGATLGKAIRDDQRFDKTRLIMMTSMGERGDAQYFADLGFSAYFPKPTTTSDLFDALAIVIGGGEALLAASPLVTHHYLQSLTSQEKTAGFQAETALGARHVSAQKPEFCRLLLVEDNLINQQVALGLLEEFGYSADIAQDGFQAIAMLERCADEAPYQLVLMDCQLPLLDGYEATAMIRKGQAGQHNAKIPIVAMTAHAMEGDREKCIIAGMDDYITKPIDPDIFEEKLSQWLGVVVSERKSGGSTQVARGSEQYDCVSIPILEQEANNAVNTGEDLVWDMDSALKRVRGKEKFLTKLIGMFLDDMPGRVKSLQQAIEQGDTDKAREVAHAIKGVVGNLSGIRLQKIAAQLENSGREKDSGELERLWPVFEKQFQLLFEELEKFQI